VFRMRRLALENGTGWERLDIDKIGKGTPALRRHAKIQRGSRRVEWCFMVKIHDGTLIGRIGKVVYSPPACRGTARVAPGGMVFHVLNRGVGRMQLFDKAGDFQAFERVLKETCDDSPMGICAYALMPNHWHLLLWPDRDGDLATFLQRLTITYVRRWQEHRHDVGLGHVYQGRYKSFPDE
jgi:REP element-mobilizing transposase RayT